MNAQRKDKSHQAEQPSQPESARPSSSAQPQLPQSSPTQAASTYRCDGRRYCRQMTSCAEAKYFLAHCPGVKMDGDHDGIPCENQWCTK
ncbi:MAG: excalibur calcium-binding domain-containing protein [Ideonella sp.]|nr:excalibur calcium-binding domain-containing protein [Ideonella sp.]